MRRQLVLEELSSTSEMSSLLAEAIDYLALKPISLCPIFIKLNTFSSARDLGNN